MPAIKRTVTTATVPFRAKMKKVIRDEAKALSLIAGKLVTDGPVVVEGIKVCKGPGHCAMGALMYAAGISNKRINQFEDSLDLGDYGFGPIARKLFDTYHIDAADANTIISNNDTVSNRFWQDIDLHKETVTSRMERVLDTIDDLPQRTRKRPSLKQPLDEASF